MSVLEEIRLISTSPLLALRGGRGTRIRQLWLLKKRSYLTGLDMTPNDEQTFLLLNTGLDSSHLKQSYLIHTQNT